MIVKSEIDEIQSYLTDASGYKGNFSTVYIPNNHDELRAIISELNSTQTPYTISGGGTGLNGGRTATEGVIISIENLNNILEVDYSKCQICVEPGVRLSEIQNELNAHGYFLPPNPTENSSTIGGNVATNASGSRSFKYGSVRNWIKELKIILPNGDEVHLTRENNSINSNTLTLISSQGVACTIPVTDLFKNNIKNAAGYYIHKDMEAIDLFIGSEGTLGTIAEITLTFIPEPDKVIGMNIFFDSEEKMLEFIGLTRSLSVSNNKLNYKLLTNISARSVELFDNQALRLIRDVEPSIPENAAGCVWIEQECSDSNEQYLLELWLKHIEQFTDSENTWIAADNSGHERLRRFRHYLPEKVNEIVIRNGYRKLGTDAAVPSDAFKDFYSFTKSLFIKSCIDYAIWGHAGDSHLHANLIPKNQNEFDKSQEIINLIIEKVINFDGTVSAEHGIGKTKKNFLRQMYGDTKIDAMKQIKSILDPNLLVGRGNIFDI